MLNYNVMVLEAYEGTLSIFESVIRSDRGYSKVLISLLVPARHHKTTEKHKQKPNHITQLYFERI